MDKIQKIGIGTVQFGLNYGISNKHGKTSEIEIEKILNAAKAHGMKYIDTASAYGNSEEMLGNNDLSCFKIVSKFMSPSLGSRISHQLDQSLDKFNLDSIYGYLAHRPRQVLEYPEQWKELQGFKDQGTVEKIGFSLNEPKELYPLLEKGYFPDLVQVPYSYFDRRFEAIMIDLKNRGCEIHTRSTFLQGLFFMEPEKLNSFFEEVKPLLKELQKKSPLNGALMKFVVEKPFIDKVIIGVENEEQLVQNINNIKKAPALPKLESKITDNILIPSRWPKN